MIENPAEILDDIRRTLRWLVAATVVLGLAIGGLAYKSYHDSGVNHRALCNLRADLVKRNEGAKNFLVEHPNGVSGISAATIKAGIVNTQRSIDSLHSLSC